MLDTFKELHDEVLRDISIRNERISKFLTLSIGIPEPQARNKNSMKDILNQLTREDQSMIQDYAEDFALFLSENNQEDEELEVIANRNDKNFMYNRKKAKAYIDKYWNSYNPAYPSFHKGGGDCANFVSQILYAGGMPWAKVGPQNYNKSEAWFCEPGATNKDSDRRISLTWKVAASFKNHWAFRAAGHFMMSFKEARINMNDLIGRMKIGDVVQFCYANGIPWHTLAITDIYSNLDDMDIILASHTTNSNSRSLNALLKAFPQDYKIRFYNIKL